MKTPSYFATELGKNQFSPANTHPPACPHSGSPIHTFPRPTASSLLALACAPPTNVGLASLRALATEFALRLLGALIESLGFLRANKNSEIVSMNSQVTAAASNGRTRTRRNTGIHGDIRKGTICVGRALNITLCGYGAVCKQ